MKKILAYIGYITVILGLIHEAFSLVGSRLVSFTDYCKSQGITFEAGERNKGGVSPDKVPTFNTANNSASETRNK